MRMNGNSARTVAKYWKALNYVILWYVFSRWKSTCRTQHVTYRDIKLPGHSHWHFIFLIRYETNKPSRIDAKRARKLILSCIKPCTIRDWGFQHWALSIEHWEQENGLYSLTSSYRKAYTWRWQQNKRFYVLSSISFVQNRSHNVKFQLRGNVFFPNRKSRQHIDVCVRAQNYSIAVQCTWIWNVHEGFLLLSCLNVFEYLFEFEFELEFAGHSLTTKDLTEWETIYLFIYLLSSKFQTLPVSPISLKGNDDILQYTVISLCPWSKW